MVTVQQEREKKPSSFNDLACRPSDQEYRDWTTKSHTMLLLKATRSPFCVRAVNVPFTAPQRPNPALLWTRLTSTTPDVSSNHLEKYFFAPIARRFPCMKTRKGILGTWQREHPTGTSSQRQSFILPTHLQT